MTTEFTPQDHDDLTFFFAEASGALGLTGHGFEPQAGRTTDGAPGQHKRGVEFAVSRRRAESDVERQRRVGTILGTLDTDHVRALKATYSEARRTDFGHLPPKEAAEERRRLTASELQWGSQAALVLAFTPWPEVLTALHHASATACVAGLSRADAALVKAESVRVKAEGKAALKEAHRIAEGKLRAARAAYVQEAQAMLAVTRAWKREAERLRQAAREAGDAKKARELEENTRQAEDVFRAFAFGAVRV